jgi:hypothetical protein
MKFWWILKCIFSALCAFGAILDNRLESSSNFLHVVDAASLESDNDLRDRDSEQFSETETKNPDIPKLSTFQCNLKQNLVNEIKSYQPVADAIFQTVLSGSFKGRTYNELSYFVDRFGSRLAGSQNLENSIEYMLEKMTQDGLENVHGEAVTIPHWERLFVKIIHI